MASLLALLSVAAALLVGAISPEPSFVLIARTSAVSSRTAGVAAAAGVGLGSVVLATVALLGLHALLLHAGRLYDLVRAAGGVYLVFLGWKMWRTDPGTIAADGAPELSARRLRPLLSGFATQIANPKTIVVYGSVFAALVPVDFPPGTLAALPLVVFAVEAGWYGIVALAFSTRGARAAYARWENLANRLAGAVMASLGIRLLWRSGP